MNSARTDVTSFRSVWLQQARAFPFTMSLMGLAAAALVLLVLSTLVRGLGSGSETHLRLAFTAGLAGFGATAVGALLAAVLRGVSDRTEDVLLGAAAGMMLAASAFSLLMPGLESAEQLTGSTRAGAAVVAFGIGLGTWLMIGLDRLTPHQHPHVGTVGPGSNRLSRLWLFVIAITLHNLPEGMAIGVSFSQGDYGVGVPLTSAIMLQNIPEGLAVALVLRTIGLSMPMSVLLAAATGLMEPLGALVGLGLASGMAIAYPIGLGLAAGAMIFVVSHEVIPETHRKGHQTPATLGLMAGFALIMFLDTAIG